MRQPLEFLLAAVPDHALRDLILALVKNGAASPPTPPAPQDAAKKRAGWTDAAREAAVRANAARRQRNPPADAEKSAARAAQLTRNAAARRVQRAAKRQGDIGKGKAGRPNGHGPNGGNGSAGPAAAEKLWRHAAALNPEKPWRAIAQEFHLNDLDCYRRRGDIPPGLPPNAIERFLAIPRIPAE